MNADAALADGSYDAMVVDVEVDEDSGRARVELTLLAGERKGEVFAVTAAPDALAHEPIDLLGVPATVTVVAGRPSVRFEP